MLRHLLNDHPQLLCHGEVFGLKRFTRFYTTRAIQSLEGVKGQRFRSDRKYKQRLVRLFKQNSSRFIDEIILHSDEEGCEAVGFKYKTNEFFSEKYVDVTNYIKEHSDILILHLKRSNILRQFISHQLLLQKKIKGANFKNDSTPKIEPFTISIEKLNEYISDLVNQESNLKSALPKHQILEVTYEEIISNGDKEMGRILRFLQVERQVLHTPTKKILKNQESLVLNLNEVYDLFKSKNLEHRLLSGHNS